MRVLTIAKNLQIGGTQRVAQALSIGVAQLGNDVAFLAYAGLGPRKTFLDAAGIPVFGPLDEEKDALEKAIAWKPDIVHIHRSGYPDPTEAALMRAFKDSGTKIVETNVFGRFDHTIPTSLIDVHLHLAKWSLLKWRKWGGRKASPATILPNCVETDRFRPLSDAERAAAREALGVREDAFLVGRIGQPIPAKWNPAIFDVFADFRTRHPNAQMLLVGAPTGYAERAAKLPKAVREAILFREPILSDELLNEYYNSLDAFLHLSEVGESFGLVLCEAMLCEVPVVTLSTPLRDNGQLEVVQHGVGGLVANSRAGLVEALEMLVADPDLADRLAKQGRESVIARFSLDRIAKEAVAVYRAALDPAEGGLLSEKPDHEWMMSLLRNSVRPKGLLWTDAAFQFTHNPHIYRTLRRLKTALVK
ncbi:glycosyltransferase family 4 protein [Stakelama tenebrarum]|uniref:Glycosyltransferase family 4 protein n=1 Tax=Stakelama tenebrarum TaxID=2711215 RepID=A0A6G6Y471_9SPHN|nr:glycosyltransferase family 4 protein [Sphingosinithalassobacter tenebrarum]QIG79518.1 glycosyltransferase family 4 protein [Sphingosinithalassobacter tenebrarum]